MNIISGARVESQIKTKSQKRRDDKLSLLFKLLKEMIIDGREY